MRTMSASLKARFRDQVQLGPALGLTAIAVNLRKPPFDDVRVRRALSLVIDREFLAEAVWGETMSPAYSLCPPGLDNYREPAELAGRDTLPIEREEEAKALLKQVGVETRFVNTDAKTHFAYLRDGGDFDLARMSWYADYSDPQNFLFLLKSGNIGFNAGRWSDARFDGLLATAAAERDVVKRADLLFEAETIVAAELPWIPVLHYRSKALVSPRLHGIHPNLRNVAPTRYLSLDT